MKKITTRKVVLGLLLAFVLAFGVQGVAEAQTGVLTITSGNHQTKKAGETFTIGFKIVVTTPAGTSAPNGVTQAVNFASGVTLTTTRAEIAGDTLTITPAANSGTTDKISTHPYTLSYKVDGDASDGTNNGFGTAATVYIVQDSSPAATTLAFDAPPDSGYESATDTKQISPGSAGLLADATPPNLPLRYSTSGGTLYVPDGSTNGKTISRSETISSSAPVWLRMGNGTRVVSVYVEGQNAQRQTARVTVIHRYPVIRKVSGDSPKQAGSPGSRLLHPFIVQVKDAGGRNVPGQAVTFLSQFNGSANGRFSAHSDFPSTGDIPAGAPQTIIGANSAVVTTDSQGRASVYLIFATESTNVGEYTVTAQFPTGTAVTDTATYKVEFKADAVSQATAATLEKITDTDGQTADALRRVEKPLTVVVRDQIGNPKQGVAVMFQDRSGGTLRDPLSTDPGEIDSTRPTPTTQNRVIDTDTDGKASIHYTPRKGTGAQTVSASISDGGYQEVVFTVNGPPSSGGGGGGDDDEDERPATIIRTLNIDVSGTGSTRTVRVTALENGVSQRGINVTLTVSGAASLSGTSSDATPLERTLTLPSTAGTYTLRASTTASGYSAVTKNVTVTLPGSISLSLVGNEVNGSQTLQIIVRNAAGTQVTTPVTVTLSGAGISRTVDVTGSQRVPISLPTTSGTLTARAPGYNDGTLTLPARSTGTGTGTGTSTGTGTGTGTASRVQIRSNAFPSGTVNTQLASPLAVRVLDATGNGVRDVRVTFEVISGQGRLSTRGNGRAIRIQTNSRGEASAPYTPLSASSQVRATAAGVSQTVTFTITTGSAPPTDSAAGATTGTARQYKVRDNIPISLESTLTFRDSRTISGTTYTCVGPGECVVSYGVVVKGQIRSEVQKPAATYKVRDKIPVSLEDTLTFRGSHTVNGTIYTCVSEGTCVVSYGVVVKGEIRSAAQKPGAPAESGTITPKVLVAAAQRPPIVWIDGGKIYALVGKDVQEFAPIVDNAQNIAIGGTKVYWTEKTGEQGGSINSANLDGTGVTEITKILATPTGIAVDTAGSKIYVANTGGRILRMNLDGSGIQTVRHNLQDPVDIALSGGNAYWTQATGSVRFVSLSGTQDIRNISTGTDAANSLVIAGGKVYWTEQTGNRGGTINSANLNGTGATQVASILAGPTGIAVDTARSKIYVANTGGRILRMNLDGSFIETVIDGLGSPGDMVISNSIQAPAMPTPTPTPTTASNKYDVNGDGSVDSKDSDVLLLAVAADLTDAKYDVNGDGKVDITDVVAVTENRDKGAAAAPALIRNIKLSAIQIVRLQEQIDLLIATGDRSPAALKTLIYLQQLIALARPEQTQLLANYPNPFNPETWIPYELATDTDVRITIYNAQGVVIRTLHLGQQSAGYYTDRQRAAYWDGRNALGEQVASGIYFYQLETDEISSLRKMVILK